MVNVNTLKRNKCWEERVVHNFKENGGNNMRLYTINYIEVLYMLPTSVINKINL